VLFSKAINQNCTVRIYWPDKNSGGLYR